MASLDEAGTLISAEYMSYIGNYFNRRIHLWILIRLPPPPPPPPSQAIAKRKAYTTASDYTRNFSGKWSFPLLITLATSLYWIVGLAFHYDII